MSGSMISDYMLILCMVLATMLAALLLVRWFVKVSTDYDEHDTTGMYVPIHLSWLDRPRPKALDTRLDEVFAELAERRAETMPLRRVANAVPGRHWTVRGEL